MKYAFLRSATISSRLPAFSSDRMPCELLRVVAIWPPWSDSVVRHVDYPGTAVGRRRPMKVVVTGATGNKGTSLLQALGVDPRVTEIVGIARRLPTREMPKTRWVGLDVAEA